MQPICDMLLIGEIFAKFILRKQEIVFSQRKLAFASENCTNLQRRKPASAGDGMNMENLIFALNATVPIFLTLLLGMLFKKMGFFDDHVVKKLNAFVFKVALPASLFKELATQNFQEAWDLKFVLFCAIVTILSIAIAMGVAALLKDRSIQGEFIQASYRSSAAILGIAFITNLYGNAGAAPLMIIGSVPIYNICAVVVLSFFKPNRGKIDGKLIQKTLLDIAKNPIIWGILLGLVWSLLRIPTPEMFLKTVNNMGVLATPLGIMAMGAAFEPQKALAKLKPAAIASFIKLLGLEIIFLPIAVLMGFREAQLISIMVMLGSATTVSSYIMARNMDHEGTFTSAVVMITTILCSFSLTLVIFILKSLGLV